MTFYIANLTDKKFLILLCLLLKTFFSVAQLQADFTTDKAGGCSPLTITSFTNTTTGTSGTTTYKWDLGNGNTSTLKEPGATYREEKTYTVTLTVTSGSQTSTKTKQITVYKKPAVDFSASKQKGCSPLNVDFTANATPGDGTISAYFWDFGDGGTQSAASAPINHTFNFTGKFPVGLTVTNSYGCYNTLTKPDLVDVQPGIKVAFAADKTTLCKTGDAVSFNNTSTGPAGSTYLWDFGDGKTSTEQSPSYVYNQKGTYTVKLTVSSASGCSETITQTNYINVANFNSSFDVPASACEKANVNFSNTSTPAPTSSNWQIDNNGYSYGSSASYYFTATGDHVIKLTNTFGTCVESISKTITVKKAPQLNGFIANMGGVCGAPVTVTFKDTSTDAVKWLWNFNYPYSQNTAAVKEPSFTFTSESYYTVGLTITNAEGCSTTATKYINIAKPNIFIKVLSTSGSNNSLSGCTGLTMKFAGSPAADITEYKWDFGDGSTSVVEEPEHTFSAAGNYTVRLNYTTTSGCKGVAQYYNITVYQKPKADFSSLSGTTICGNTPVNFSATSTNGVGLYNLYWLFGDNDYSYYNNGQSVFHQYYKDTVYTVTLIVSNGGCSDTVIKKDYIKVLPPFPKIASATNTCNGTRGTVTFLQSSKKAITGVWDFGDGTTTPLDINQSAISHTYTKTGAFKVVLTATNDQCSVRDSLTAYVLLRQQPLLSTTKTEACGSNQLDVKVSDLEVNPYNLSNYYYYPYSITSFLYGDNSAFIGSISSSNYNWTNVFTGNLQLLKNGQKDLRAIIKSNYFGCSDTSNLVPIKIKGPEVNFNITENNVCYKSPVVFTDKSAGTNNVEIKTWDWTFGDGKNLSFNNNNPVKYVYQNPGQYNVVLKVTDADGCSAATSSYSNYALVNGPKAAFSYYPTSVSPNTTVSFYNNSNNYNSNNSTYTWIFPDGTTSSTYYPSYKFTNLGTDTVKLVAKNPSTGCSDTAVQVINVKNVNAAFTYTTSYIQNNGCPPVVIKFTNTSLNYTSVGWNFGDGTKADNQNYPSHTYNNPGVYNVTLYIKGFNGLTDSTVEPITVKGPYAILKADVMSGCTSQEVTLSAEVKNAVKYTWDFGDGSLQDTKDTFAIHQYLSPGIYIPALILKDAGGCSGTSELSDKIVIDTLDVTFKNSPRIVCNEAFAYFNPAIQSLAVDQMQQALQYKWQFGTGNEKDTSDLSSPYFSYNNPGKYAVRVKVTSPYGCVREATDTIEVLQRAKARIQAPAEICQSSLAKFAGTAGFDTGVTWKWIFGNGDTSNVQNPPDQLYSDSGTVKIKLVVNNAGCYDTATNDLVVRPKPNINLTPKQSNVCLGRSVQLTAGGGDVFVWRADAGLDNYSTAQPLAAPEKNTRYQVEVTNAYGCKNLDSATVTVSAPFKVRLPADTAICQNKDLQLVASGASTYKWINNTTGINNTAIPNPVARSLVPVVYTVVGYDAYNCFSDTASVNVRVVPLPTISAGPDLQVLTGSTVTLQTTASSDVVKYAWSPADYLNCTDCAAPVSTPRTNITYVVTGITQFGCSTSDTINIKLICDQSHVYIPTAFTPNNDYKNDVFYIKGRGVKIIKFLKIFNRFGEAVFEKDNFQIEDRSSGWDGKQNGVEVSTGAYVYFTEMVCDNGETFSLKGTVMVVK